MGDVAGMGAGSLRILLWFYIGNGSIGCCGISNAEPDAQFNAILAPMLIAAFGVILSLLGIFLVKTKEGASQQQLLLRALDRGINVSSLLIVGCQFPGYSFARFELLDMRISDRGLVTGIIIGKATEYYTSHAYKPTQVCAKVRKRVPQP